MDAESVKKNLCRFGGTPYVLKAADIKVEEGLMLPVSKLNALRRSALAALTEAGRGTPTEKTPTPLQATGKRLGARSARFERAAQITPAASDYFEYRYLPLHAFDERVANGVVIPPVILDGEVAPVREALKKAAERGAKHALVGNVGHLSLALEAGLVPHGDFRLNVCNGQALATALLQGFADVLLSPELMLPQIRDIEGACDCIVYGRIPLMLLEKCVGKEIGDCARCASGKNTLTDRRGEKFPVFRIEGANGAHRNSLCNSRPTVMSDRRAELRAARITAGHYIFTTETPDEVDAVIRAYKNGTSLGDKVRRI
jgi:putative protease